jgi:hypothetical protein
MPNGLDGALPHRLQLRADATEVTGELRVSGGAGPGRIRFDDEVDGPQLTGSLSHNGASTNTTLNLEATRTVVAGALSVEGQELLRDPPPTQPEAWIRAQGQRPIAIDAPTIRITGDLKVDGTLELPVGAHMAASDLSCTGCVSGDEIALETVGLRVQTKRTDGATRKIEEGYTGSDKGRYITARSLPCGPGQVRTGGGCRCRSYQAWGSGACGPDGCDYDYGASVSASYPVVTSRPWGADRWMCVCDTKYREQPAVLSAVEAWAVCLSLGAQ